MTGNNIIDCQNLMVTYGVSENKMHRDSFICDLNEVDDLIFQLIAIMDKYGFPAWSFERSSVYQCSKEYCTTRSQLATELENNIEEYFSGKSLNLTKK